MNRPQIELIPSREAVCTDQDITLDVLIKITPPLPDVPSDRTPLNLGLVIDRSGSMGGYKIDYARQAACFAVEELLPTDRVSITLFDNQIDTLIPSTLVNHKASILSQIKRIHARGSTALHQGWLNGGVQVSQHLDPQCLNRVLLLSDGLANVGETNPDRISQDVHGLQQKGISTTTLGLGEDYDEDLLLAMAQSGDGNFYHIQSPEELPNIFEVELQGLMATVGRVVSLGIEPQGEGKVLRVLNNLERTPKDRLKLANLVMGKPILVVVRLQIPAQASGQGADNLCQFRLAWNSPDTPDRQELRATLSLEAINHHLWEQLPENKEVAVQVALFMAAQAREEAIAQADRGNYYAVAQIIDDELTDLEALGDIAVAT
ncbi:VWA domain-containing protein [Candidatus Synechococcus calcipolaris G9]|uniref:VWA domain-containing protein n=1 Tax=Candidatus Synechococcus calcipolaris G9 TaxID=1497997 RepID=A0ABT6EUX2_9SYNE|nr:VWA domain-containing protein [Candidatus Synechococcus calcipolaris]MDG2989638.1 VWA domain-containing protein [Candidatus Synechococcus calcipolaris G9]